LSRFPHISLQAFYVYVILFAIIIIRKEGYTMAKELPKRSEVKKEYTAVCLGKVPESGTVTAKISRPDPKSILRLAGDEGEEAVTEYKVISTCDTASLVSVFPITGRTHQIRVHMKYLGAPVLGDTLYSVPSDLIDRQALHATRVTFTHPFTKKTISVTCPLFEDMKSCIKALFGDFDNE